MTEPTAAPTSAITTTPAPVVISPPPAPAAVTTPPAPMTMRKRWGMMSLYVVSMIGVGVLTAAVALLWQNISDRKSEAQQHAFRVVELSDDLLDPAEWGKNYPRQYDSYKRTVDLERTRHGGNESPFQPRGVAGREPSKLDLDPKLLSMYAGYPFSTDYREARGHAYMLSDQDVTERTTKFKQPGACLHCHASIVPCLPTTTEELAPCMAMPALPLESAVMPPLTVMLPPRAAKRLSSRIFVAVCD